jgi:peptidoglycan/xylan/chitin deacetylase (PgdA/CDA1 family)
MIRVERETKVLRRYPVLMAIALATVVAGLPGAAHTSALAATPSGFAASARDGRYVDLSWQRVPDDYGTFLYRVFRDGLAIGARQHGVSYLDRPAIGRHQYQVRAIDGTGRASPLSPAIVVWAVSRLAGSNSPSAPNGLHGETGANGQAHLAWNAADGTSPEMTYRVYRENMLIASVQDTTFDDYRAGLEAGAYDYAVQTVDGTGVASALTEPVRITVEPQDFPWSGVRWFGGPATSPPTVALTFDDCNSVSAMTRIVSILRAYEAPATFFCIGEAVVAKVDVITDIARDFPVGNHSWSHPDLNTLSDAAVLKQMTTATRKIESATGRPLVPVMRPPYGHADPRVRGDLKLLGLAVVRWTVDTNDWRSTTTSQDVLRSALQATNGGIVLMHDRSKTADVLGQIITGLRNKGYRLVTVPEMLGIPWLTAEADY